MNLTHSGTYDQRTPMAVDTFTSNREFLAELLRKVDDGRIRLPDFQRG